MQRPEQNGTQQDGEYPPLPLKVQVARGGDEAKVSCFSSSLFLLRCVAQDGLSLGTLLRSLLGDLSFTWAWMAAICQHNQQRSFQSVPVCL